MQNHALARGLKYIHLVANGGGAFTLQTESKLQNITSPTIVIRHVNTELELSNERTMRRCSIRIVASFAEPRINWVRNA